MNPQTKPHNLDIQQYSLDELLGLFDMNAYSPITLEQLKYAQKKVLMLHPDKSRLDASYFLFYKKALDVVVQYYNHQHRQDIQVTPENSQYVLPSVPKSTTGQINQVIEKMGSNGFQQKFNQLFEENMVKKPDTDKNAWFSSNDPVYDNLSATNAKQIGEVFENIKQKNQGMVKYLGVSEMNSSGVPGGNFYEDELQEDQYVSCDPFSKLKFDDLRKVHKDQTILAVGESDFNKVKTYGTVEQMNRERESHDLTPLTKDKSEKLLAEKQRLLKEKMSQKQHESLLITKKYEEKNKSILSTFLQLT